jgi:hypothetical protein
MKSRIGDVVAPIHSMTVSAPVAVGTVNKETKRCPWCNNLVHRLAKLCKGCGFMFTLPETLKKCPRCSEMLFAFSVLCPSCRFDIEAYFHELRVKGHHVEEEVREFMTDRVVPKVREYEHEIAELAHHRRAREEKIMARTGPDQDRKEREKRALILFSRKATTIGTTCFRCGSPVLAGAHRCPKCRVKILMT